MAESCTCSNCGKRLRVGDKVRGKAVRCPACGKIFTAAIEEEEEGGAYGLAPQSEKDEKKTRPSKRAARSAERDENSEGEGEQGASARKRGGLNPAAWRNVARGVNLVLAGASLNAAALVAYGLGSRFFQLFLLLDAVGGLFTLAGYGFCVAGPSRHGAKWFAVGSLASAALPLIVLGIIALAVSGPSRPSPEVALILLGLLLVMPVVSFLLFLFFLRATIVRTLRESEPAAGIRHLMVLYVIVLVELVAFIVVMLVLASSRQDAEARPHEADATLAVISGAIGSVALGVQMFFLVAAVFWYLGVLLFCQQALRAKLRRMHTQPAD